MMKKLLIFISFLILAAMPAFAQDFDDVPWKMTLFEQNGIKQYCYDSVCVSKIHDKFGLTSGKSDNAVKYFLPFEYDLIYPVERQGIWLLKKDGKFGLFYKEFNRDTDGRYLLNCEYDEISKVGALGFKVRRGAKYAFFGSYDVSTYGTYLSDFIYDDIQVGVKNKRNISVVKDGKQFEKSSISFSNRFHHAIKATGTSPIWGMIY